MRRGENVMETNRGGGKEKERGEGAGGGVWQERNITAETWELGSDDTGGRTSRGYV